MSWAEDMGYDAWELEDFEAYYAEFTDVSKEQQEKEYFSHPVSSSRSIDIRDIDANYARNLYKWYAAKGFDENLLYMKTLKDLSEKSAEEDFKNL